MKLELKHIQHYPIGGDNALQVQDYKGDVTKLLGFTVMNQSVFIDIDSNQFHYPLRNVKPILRPMTDLYKPLEDGSIPIVELAKLATESYGEFEHTLLIRNNAQEVEDIEICCSSRDLVNFYFKYSSAFSGFDFFSKKVDSNFDTALPVDNQLKLFEYLFKHHFNVYNLPEHLFVDINTIQD